jgi:aromatic amino acid aminotransferase I
MSSEKRTSTKALDHSHHISDYARRYALSPLKALQKYFDKDLISFSGGTCVFPRRSLVSHPLAGFPSPDCYPFTSVSADVLLADAFPLDAPRSASASSAFGWLWRLFGAGKDDTTRVHIPREPRPGDGGLNLTTALQYSPATGHALLQKFIREFTERIYAPAYDDWSTLVHTGNTDGCV